MKDTINFFIHILKRYKIKESIGVGITFIYTITIFLTPNISKYLIDNILVSSNIHKIYQGILIFLGVCIAQPIFGFIRDLLFLSLSEEMTYEIRRKVFCKIINAKMEFFDSSTQGEIVSRIVNDGRGVGDFISNVFIITLKNIVLCILVLSGMIIMCPVITLIVIVLFLIYILINIYMSMIFRRMAEKSLYIYDDYCTSITQSLTNMFLIKTVQGEKKTSEEYEDNLKKIYTNNLKVGRLRAILNAASNVIVVISLSIIYGLGAILTMQGSITLGTVVALGLYFQLLVQPIQELINNNVRLQQMVPIVNRIQEYLNLEQENIKKHDKEISLPGQVGINLSNISFSYKNKTKNTVALKNINVNIMQNGLYGLVGKSGSGKSTIGKIVMGFYEADEGNVIIYKDGHNLDTLEKRRNEISYTAQDIQILHKSIIDNLRLGNNASFEEIVKICQRLGLHEKICSFKEGYEHILSENAELSGGEIQRLGIARAYLKKASVFIFDEVTSALDKTTCNAVKDILYELSTTAIVIVITHELSVLEKADWLYVISKGEVVDRGYPVDILRKKEFLNVLKGGKENV